MAIPKPEPDLVISYSYVWDHEAQGGQEEGRKDRPCVIAPAIERQKDGETLVTVLPVTHSPPIVDDEKGHSIPGSTEIEGGIGRYHVRATWKASPRFQLKDKAHYACLLEVFVD